MIKVVLVLVESHLSAPRSRVDQELVLKLLCRDGFPTSGKDVLDLILPTLLDKLQREQLPPRSHLNQTVLLLQDLAQHFL